MKFKSDIELQSGLRDGDNDIGAAGQILSSTGSKTNWIDQSSIVASESKLVFIECKNTSGNTISKGTPVYQTGTVGATDVIEIDVADASDEDKMAAIGLLQTDLANNAFGKVVITGELLNITTSLIDGVTPVTGDTIYVKSGGGLTLTKPTGVNFIQNIGLVGKVSGGNSGSITVSSIMRSNDVPTPLYIDHANQRLGIGETNPTAPLHIHGGAESEVLKVEATNNPFMRFVQNGTDVGFLQFTGGTAYLANMANGAFRFRTNNTDQMILTHQGRLGIGTTSPSEKLVVQDGNLIVSGSSSELAIGPAAGKSRIFTNSSKDIRFSTATTNDAVFIKNNNGNVGIGTTSPSAKLHISESAAASTANLLYLENTGSGGNEGVSIKFNPMFGATSMIASNREGADAGKTNLTFHNCLVNDAAPIERMRITSSGNVGIGTTSPSEKLHVDGDIRQEGSTHSVNITGGGSISGDNHLDIAANASYLNLRSPNNSIYYRASSDHAFRDAGGSNEYLRIKTSGTTAGNVGIGTTNPSAKLNIVDSNPKIVLEDSDNTGTFGQIRQQAGNLQFLSNNNTSNGTIQFKLDDGTSTTDAMYIASSSNVGIGTTSPNVKLEVADSEPIIRLTDTRNLNNPDWDNVTLGRIQFKTSDTTSPGARVVSEIEAYSSGQAASAPNSELRFKTSTSTESTATTKMVITSDGKVGIGTTSPNRKLSVYQSSSSLVADFRSASGNNSYISLSNNASTADQVRIGSASGSLVLMTSYNERVRVTSSGDVGIGTTSPSVKLDVAGDIISRDTYPTIYVNHSGTTLGGIRADATTKLEFKTLTAAPISFQVNSSQKMLITDSGNVGIGTNSPQEKLDISAGNIRLDDNQRISWSSSDSNIGRVRITGNEPGNFITIATGNSDRVRINNTGVGIGTTSPSEKLDVWGNIRLRTSEGNATNKLIPTNYNGNSALKIKGGNYVHRLFFETDWNDFEYASIQSSYNTSESFFNLNKSNSTGGVSGTTRISTGNSYFNGNVGIGTINPSTKLEVISATNEEGIAIKDASGNLKYKVRQFGGNTYSSFWNSSHTEQVRINSSGTSYFNGGNVGIGTTSPTSKFQVSANNGDGITLKHGASNAFYILRDGNDDTIIKQTRNYTSKISISTLADSGTHESSGLNIVGQGVGLKSNVGIGTASPVYKLDVDGGARAGGVITYSKSAGSLDTTGYAVAGLTSSSNGNSTGFTFTCFGNTGDYQKIVYSCYNALGTWKTKKVIDEGTNDFDIAASADGSTITFTFKSTSGTKNYTPRVTVEAVGSAINSTYA